MSRARKLAQRSTRHETRQFLAEGPQAVREALRAGLVDQLFVSDQGQTHHPELVDAASIADVEVIDVDAATLRSLSDTVAGQGLLATVNMPDPVGLEVLSGPNVKLVAIAFEAADPGNVGTIIRIADAAGADAVVLTEASCDPFNSKAVRASTGSVFHLPIIHSVTLAAVVEASRAAGVAILAATGDADHDIFDPLVEQSLIAPTAWLFGNEAHGIPAAALAMCDQSVKIPIFGQAESLNVAAAAAICLYSSARVQQQG